MNLVDIMRLDLTKPTIRFLRQKTMRYRPDDQSTEFTIQPEARALIDKLIVKGQIQYKHKDRTYCSLTRTLNRHLKDVAEECGIDSRLIFYSARKTFTQLANELMITVQQFTLILIMMTTTTHLQSWSRKKRM